jgi:hypothetical protein
MAVFGREHRGEVENLRAWRSVRVRRVVGDIAGDARGGMQTCEVAWVGGLGARDGS